MVTTNDDDSTAVGALVFFEDPWEHTLPMEMYQIDFSKS